MGNLKKEKATVEKQEKIVDKEETLLESNGSLEEPEELKEPQAQAQAEPKESTGEENLKSAEKVKKVDTKPAIQEPLNTLFVASKSYSGRSVLQVSWKQVSLMKRKQDSYVNASQILKAAKLKKLKRKEILKKLMKQVPFEKIEEGFFEYQGVWVPQEAAKRLGETWGLSHVLEPLFLAKSGTMEQ